MKLSNVPWTLQEEYQGEGISWHNIDYTDNVGCIHLISKKPTGLFYLLDEESKWVSTAHCMCQPRRSVFFLAPYPESRPSLGASEFLRLIWPNSWPHSLQNAHIIQTHCWSWHPSSTECKEGWKGYFSGASHLITQLQPLKFTYWITVLQLL